MSKKLNAMRGLRLRFVACVIGGLCLGFQADGVDLTNHNYRLQLQPDCSILVKSSTGALGMQRCVPEFVVTRSEKNPALASNFNHYNYAISPRTGVRWLGRNEPADVINRWLSSPEVIVATGGWKGSVRDDAEGRVWEYRDAAGAMKLRVAGAGALGTTRPFAAGDSQRIRATRAQVQQRQVIWDFEPTPSFEFSARLALAIGGSDPELTLEFTPKLPGWYSIAFTGAPGTRIDDVLPVPQECSGRGGRQFGYVMTESHLKLPRAMVASRNGSVSVVAHPSECRFRLPKLADSRFGLMLELEEGLLKPVILAPLLGGAESKMDPGQKWRFSSLLVIRAGDWKEAYRHIGQNLMGVKDQRDASGPGSLNDCLGSIMDFLGNKNGRNYAMWHDEQKYYDYFNDQTGVFKPFSPLYGLSAAIVTDDEEFFKKRARPAIEYALSRKTGFFRPYEGVNEQQAGRSEVFVGGPYIGYAQLLALDELLQRRSPVIAKTAEDRGPVKNSIADALARWQRTGEESALAQARSLAATMIKRGPVAGEQALFDMLELGQVAHDTNALAAAREAAYAHCSTINLYPAPPDTFVTADSGGKAPVHLHSFGRHKMWGYMPPEPVSIPEQKVPAWRLARIGTPSPAYPMEYWMNAHGGILRAGAMTGDTFLKSIARCGMVGRFANFPGDNRSFESLVSEYPQVLERPPWDWNWATVNPGHAWDFAGTVLDFIVTDAFDRSAGEIDFPAESAAGSSFRVRIYGARPGRFYDQKNVRLWLPRGLVITSNKQLDWLTAYNEEALSLALWNQSASAQASTVKLDSSRIKIGDGEIRFRVGDKLSKAPIIQHGQFEISVPPKGIISLIIPAKVHPTLQSRLYAGNNKALGADSYTQATASFGKIHAMLLNAGRDLTSAFVYTEALPGNVIGARLFWRQGIQPWQTMDDLQYPYEFSPELKDDAGDFECVMDIETAGQETQRSTPILLRMGVSSKPLERLDLPAPTPVMQSPVTPGQMGAIELSPDFIAYLKTASNPLNVGLKNGRFYPYSTPMGRVIAFRQRVWDKGLFSAGCTEQEAEERLRGDLARFAAELRETLPLYKQGADFDKLALKQREMLLDFANSEGVSNLRKDFLSAVLESDWATLASKHLYVRYGGPAPDHYRNRAFAHRWIYPELAKN